MLSWLTREDTDADDALQLDSILERPRQHCFRRWAAFSQTLSSISGATMASKHGRASRTPRWRAIAAAAWRARLRKSVELKRLSESAGLPNTRLVRLGVTGEESRLERRLEQELAALHSRDGVPVLLLDSIDEALFELPKAIGVILDVLARDREANLAVPLRIAVTCRTGALPPDLLLRLQTIVGETKAFELCTLRRRDAELAASAEGIDPEAFLREVADRESEPFAANPSTLKLLLALAKSGSIPSAKVELYQHGLLGCALSRASVRQSRMSHS